MYTLEKKVYLCLSFLFLFFIYSQYGDIAQLARASALQAEGQGFESPYLHKNTKANVFFRRKSFIKKVSNSRIFDRTREGRNGS